MKKIAEFTHGDDFSSLYWSHVRVYKIRGGHYIIKGEGGAGTIWAHTDELGGSVGGEREITVITGRDVTMEEAAKGIYDLGMLMAGGFIHEYDAIISDMRKST